ncbi:MAG: hypothetical protein ACK4F9_04320 [Brevinematia bacterium]
MDEKNLSSKVYTIFLVNILMTTVFEIVLFIRMFSNKLDTSTLLVVLGIWIVTFTIVRFLAILSYYSGKIEGNRLLVFSFIVHSVMLVFAGLALVSIIEGFSINIPLVIVFVAISILFSLAISSSLLSFFSELSEKRQSLLKQMLFVASTMSFSLIFILAIMVFTPYFEWFDRIVVSLLISIVLLVSLLRVTKNLYQDLGIVNKFLSFKGNEKQKIVNEEFFKIMENLEKIVTDQYYSDVLIIKSIREIDNELKSMKEDVIKSIQTVKYVRNEILSALESTENDLKMLSTIKEMIGSVKGSLENYIQDLLPISEFVGELESSYKDIIIKLNVTKQSSEDMFNTVSSIVKNVKKSNEELPVIFDQLLELTSNYYQLTSITKDIRKISMKINSIRLLLDVELKRTDLDLRSKEKLEVISKKIDEIFLGLQEIANNLFVDEEKITIENQIKPLMFQTKEIQVLLGDLIRLLYEFVNYVKSLTSDLEISKESFGNFVKRYQNIKGMVGNLSLVLDKSLEIIGMILDDINNVKKPVSRLLEAMDRIESSLEEYYSTVSSLFIRIPKFVEDTFEV